MKLNKPCQFCGEFIQYDTYYDKYKDCGDIIHVVRKSREHILAHKECYYKNLEALRREALTTK